MMRPTVIIIAVATLLKMADAQVYCPDNTVPQMRSDGQGAMICNYPNQQDVCNSGYICKYNPNNSPSNFANVCCRAAAGEIVATAASCPNGLVAYTNPTTRQLVPCLAGNVGSCPQGATCEYVPANDSNLRYLCCYNGISVPTSNVDTSAGAVACPNNESPWEPSPGQYVPCLMNMAENCPSGSNCRSMQSNRLIYRTLCCRDPNAPAFCAANQIRNNGVCLPQVELDKYCQITTQCLGGSECILNQCRCPAGRVNSNGQCVVNDGTIAVVTCNSNQAFVNGRCMMLVPPGVACQDSKQCVGGSTCVSLVCTCPTGTTLADSACLPTANVQNACPTGQMQVRGQCYMPSQIDFTCSVNEQCLGGSTCTSGACRCATGLGNVNGICAPVTTVAPSNAATNARCATSTFVPMTPLTSCISTLCPTAYKCEYDSVNRQYICCGAGGINNAVPLATAAPAAATCTQSNTAMYANGSPLECKTLGTGTCPANNPYCVRSSTLGYNVCCRTNVG
uniref:EB domain-containing protein n=1 Tax=Plectus sambesii TaxID=2011161 RepID=A0A914WMN7_9BILA